MNTAARIVDYLLEVEDEDEFSVKEIAVPGEEDVAGRTTVKRYGRMKIVEMPRYTFLISYLTPVAYHDKIFNIYYETTKQWSPTTNDHIWQWKGLIRDSPAWQANPKNREKSTYGGSWVRYPEFKRKTQAAISSLFRKLMPTMEIKPHEKQRLYHVDPKMRQGAGFKKPWLSAHLKHHITGVEGLPHPDEPGFEEFFRDFTPDEPEDWPWTSGLRSMEPHERYKPDEP